MRLFQLVNQMSVPTSVEEQRTKKSLVALHALIVDVLLGWWSTREEFLDSFGYQGSKQLVQMELACAHQIPGPCNAEEIDDHKKRRQIIQRSTIGRVDF